MFKPVILTALVASSVAVSGCATDRYGYRDTQTERAVKGGAIGAAGGAVLGAVLPGVNPVTGAVVGGIAGAVLGAVVNGRQYYRDTRGYCYYVDRDGRPIYNYDVRC
jgi:hypothetical protein